RGFRGGQARTHRPGSTRRAAGAEADAQRAARGGRRSRTADAVLGDDRRADSKGATGHPQADRAGLSEPSRGAASEAPQAGGRGGAPRRQGTASAVRRRGWLRTVILAAVGALVGTLAETVHHRAGVWTLPRGGPLPAWITIVYFFGLLGAFFGMQRFEK